MPFELQAVFWNVALLFVLICLQGGLVPATFGFAWGLGNRDEPRDPTAFMRRTARTVDNQLQAIAMFAPLALIVVVADLSSPATFWGAAIFLGARIAFAAAYLVGVPYLRSAVWGVGVLGLATMALEIARLGF